VVTGVQTEPSPAAGDALVRARRVVLKLSGEVFGGGKVGVDPDVVQALARQIAAVVGGACRWPWWSAAALLPRRRALRARHGPRTGRLHGHCSGR